MVFCLKMHPIKRQHFGNAIFDVIIFEKLRFRSPHVSKETEFSKISTLESVFKKLRCQKVALSKSYFFIGNVWTGDQNGEKKKTFASSIFKRKRAGVDVSYHKTITSSPKLIATSSKLSEFPSFHDSTGILRHLTVVHTSRVFGQATKPAVPVDIEQLQEDAKKVKTKTKGVILTNHNRRKRHNGPIRTRDNTCEQVMIVFSLTYSCRRSYSVNEMNCELRKYK